MVLSAYAFGWRLTSVKTLKVGQVDMLHTCIRLYKTKNGMRPIAYMMPETQAALVPLVFGKSANAPLFTRPNGSVVDDFRQSWANVTAAAGVPDLLFHDLRRTAVRNMARSGRYTEGEIMQIVGLKTRVIFDRYNIVCEKDLREARDKWAADLAVSGSSVVAAPKSEQLTGR